MSRSRSRSLSQEVIDFCAIECELQHSGEHSVSWMCKAWSYALGELGHTPDVGYLVRLPTVDDIVQLGQIVEPLKNSKGFRTCRVWIGRFEKAPSILVQPLIRELVADIGTLDPDQWFYQYENIHPFVDGNGRSGAILFNWLNGSLLTPVWPPDFWADNRRVKGYGA